MAVRVETRGIGAYRESSSEGEFSYDAGVVPLPCGSRTAAHRLIRLHGGIGMRRVAWKVARSGRPPIIPAMADTRGDTFIGGTVNPSLPVPSASRPGGFDWSVSGEYVFVQDSPRIVGTDAFPVGSHPFVVSGQDNSAVTPAAAALNLSTCTLNQLTEALLSGVTMDPQGEFAWPFMALPARLTSTHMMGD